MKLKLDWTAIAPILALIVLGAAALIHGALLTALAAVALAFAVFAAVHHAEVVAHRVGEPFGTLVLAVAVTVIEVALIVSVMLSGGPEKAALPRDTVFAAIMICGNGIVGLCLLLGGLRHHVQDFQLQGASAALAILCALSVLTLVLPNFTSTVAGPALSTSQLVFVGVVSLVLYIVFVFVQTIRHRDYFLPFAPKATSPDAADDGPHAPPPTNAQAWAALALLMLSLVAVVGLAKLLSPAVEAGVAAAGAPEAVVGVVIAALVLLPEGFAALRAARLDRLQTSLNLALGSALASIGLTIPAVAVVSIAIGQPIALGLAPKEITMLALTLLVSVITLGTGRSTVLQGVVHLVIFAAFLFLSVVP
ncbi:ionic transporter y4hA [Caballeronia sp. LZ062]|uniref:calcium:proton antiporter n=1 Tax=unclassified Caballeronia TaxID=2646786 RepID=UPI00285480C8|nr:MULTISPECIES: ionic transporter y4hA [unclassified Caballeronia]MDR5857507.1 ionic transporter y4hA [Caballeronia sp. LZ050]MDR5869057.1 ionic transporter y4hA [Caballeronia sp. LZ062]